MVKTETSCLMNPCPGLSFKPLIQAKYSEKTMQNYVPNHIPILAIPVTGWPSRQ